jgi:hypothetical protein
MSRMNANHYTTVHAAESQAWAAYCKSVFLDYEAAGKRRQTGVEVALSDRSRVLAAGWLAAYRERARWRRGERK